MLLFHHRLLFLDMAWLGTLLVYAAAVLTVWSMFYYMKLAWPQILAKTGSQP